MWQTKKEKARHKVWADTSPSGVRVANKTMEVAVHSEEFLKCAPKSAVRCYQGPSKGTANVSEDLRDADLACAAGMPVRVQSL